MFDSFKQQLHSHVGLQANITNTNHFRLTIITHLQHSKITRSVRCEELLPSCNMQCSTTINNPHALIRYKINGLKVTKKNKITTSSSSDTIITTIILFLLALLIYIVLFPLKTIFLNVPYFIIIMTLYILIS